MSPCYDTCNGKTEQLGLLNHEHHDIYKYQICQLTQQKKEPYSLNINKCVSVWIFMQKVFVN